MNNNEMAQNMRKESDIANVQHINAVSGFMKAYKDFEDVAPISHSEIAEDIKKMFGSGDWQKIRTTYSVGRLEELTKELKEITYEISGETLG